MSKHTRPGGPAKQISSIISGVVIIFRNLSLSVTTVGPKANLAVYFYITVQALFRASIVFALRVACASLSYIFIPGVRGCVKILWG